MKGIVHRRTEEDVLRRGGNGKPDRFVRRLPLGRAAYRKPPRIRLGLRLDDVAGGIQQGVVNMVDTQG